MQSTNTFQVRETDIREHGRKLRLVVKFGMHYIPGNSHPYFSLTAETRRYWRGRPYKTESCGCLHDTILKAFPDLAKAAKWHLADQDGLPMHYKANALYWRDCLLGKYERRSYDPDPIKTFASHVCYGTVEGDDEMGVEERMRSRDLGDWLDKRAEALQEAFKADMTALGVPLMVYTEEGHWRSSLWAPVGEAQAIARTARGADEEVTTHTIHA